MLTPALVITVYSDAACGTTEQVCAFHRAWQSERTADQAFRLPLDRCASGNGLSSYAHCNAAGTSANFSERIRSARFALMPMNFSRLLGRFVHDDHSVEKRCDRSLPVRWRSV